MKKFFRNAARIIRHEHRRRSGAIIETNAAQYADAIERLQDMGYPAADARAMMARYIDAATGSPAGPNIPYFLEMARVVKAAADARPAGRQ